METSCSVKCCSSSCFFSLSVKPGVRYRELGNIIQKHAQANGFSVVRSYCGHGIHKLFHTAPNVPHYASEYCSNTLGPSILYSLKECICCEYTLSRPVLPVQTQVWSLSYTIVYRRCLVMKRWSRLLFPSTHLFPSPVTMTSSPSQQITCQKGMEMLGRMCLGVVVYQPGMSINHLYLFQFVGIEWLNHI